MRAKRSFRRNVRSGIAIALKFAFLLGMGIELLMDFGYAAAAACVDAFGLRCVLEYGAQILARIDDWLRERSPLFAFAIIAILGLMLGALEIYKASLLIHREFALVTAISIADKFTCVAVFKHLLHVYGDVLLSFDRLRLVYEKCAAIRARAIMLFLGSKLFREFLALRAHIRESWSAYSIVALAKRAAHRHECCLLVFHS